MRQYSLFTSIFACAVMCATAFADADKKPLPADKSSDLAKIEVRTIVGPQRTTTVIEKKSGVVTLEMFSSGREKISRKLTAEDFSFIVENMKSLPKLAELPAGCARFRMDITASGLGEEAKSRQGCLGQKTSTSDQFKAFAKVIEAALL